MNIDELRAMLERRGYTRETVTSEESKLAIGRVLYAIEHGETFFGAVESTRDVAYQIDQDLANWQHHVWCENCHEPLLQGGISQPNERVEALLGVSEQEIAAMKARASRFVYRSAKAGPYSPVLERCPQCQNTLSGDSVEEIEDV